ncbi:hypothetical protein ACFYR1_50975 [Streptomyces canus]|uniref:hypothetical protein n=1 Tax=Streptomyces canus TaxID=58343 RepID=UPI00367726CC
MKAAIERPDTGDGRVTDTFDDRPESDVVGFSEDDAEAGPQATAAFPYECPVANLIDELSATGHVTHKSYKKTSADVGAAREGPAVGAFAEPPACKRPWAWAR